MVQMAQTNFAVNWNVSCPEFKSIKIWLEKEIILCDAWTSKNAHFNDLVPCITKKVRLRYCMYGTIWKGKTASSSWLRTCIWQYFSLNSQCNTGLFLANYIRAHYPNINLKHRNLNGNSLTFTNSHKILSYWLPRRSTT